MRRAFGRFAVGSCAILCIAGLLVTVGWFRLLGSGEPLRGSVPVEGLDAPVDVHVDSLGVPHVFASGESDMLRALGYLHATDRLWQMEYFRRIAAGRLAEIFGPGMVSTDRFLRTMELWSAAEQAGANLNEADRRLLEAYVAGVNARLATRGIARPPEFVLLRFRPEPWDVTSCLAIGMVMNLDLSHWRRDLSRFWASRHMPEDRVAYLRLGYPPWGETILDSPVPLPAILDSPVPQPDPAATTADGAPSDDAGASAVAGPGAWEAFALLESLSARSASNAWVIGPERTASGHPILANDMHLALRAPALWYLAALHADSADFHAVGFTLPGIPGIVVGHNRAVAWGFTNGMVDDMDFAVESLSDDGSRYLENGSWLELQVRPETVRVRGAEPEVVAVRHTRRGPLISDALPGLEADIAAVWVATQSEARTMGILDMNRARDLEGFDRTLQSFAQPHQNVVFATTEGRIGYRLGGRIPARRGWDGSIPVSAERMGDGFAGTWPPESHPAVLDPPSGFIASANNLQAPGLGTVISTDYAAPLRAGRISDRLRARSDWSIESVAELQRDTYSLLADRLLPLARRTAAGSGRSEVVRTLDAWDRWVELESRGAPVFYSWAYRLRSLIAADEYATGPEWSFFPLKSFLAVLEEGDASPWVDDVTTPDRETIDGLADVAWRDATAAIGEATWGELHGERHAHPLGQSPWLQRFIGFHIGPDPSPGGPNTVRPDDYRKWFRLDSTSWSPPWISEYGPSERFVARLEPDGPQGWFLIPTGQSGNPFSPHYRDFHRYWQSGELVHVPLDRERAVDRAIRRLTLLPATERD
jgi:penicillin amidase